jgi:hypothetical protein
MFDSVSLMPDDPVGLYARLTLCPSGKGWQPLRRVYVDWLRPYGVLKATDAGHGAKLRPGRRHGSDQVIAGMLT